MLAPYVVKITGPLIRIVGDRFPAEVKSAILQTLGLLLSKNGPQLKAFLPQLQTTFTKALHDLSPSVRTPAAEALSDLSLMSRKVDPIITELTGHIQAGLASREEPDASAGPVVGGPPSSDAVASMLQAMANMLQHADVTSKIAPNVLDAARAVAFLCIRDDRAGLSEGGASVLGCLMQHSSDEQLVTVLSKDLIQATPNEKSISDRCNRLIAFGGILRRLGGSARIPDAQFASIVKFTLSGLKEEEGLQAAAISTAGRLLVSCCDPSSPPERAAATANAVITALTPLLVEPGAMPQVKGGVIEQLERMGRAPGAAQLLTAQPAVLRQAVEALVSRREDILGFIRRNSQQALYFILQCNKGAAASDQMVELAMRAIDQAVGKKNSEPSQALLAYVKKTIVKVQVQEDASQQ